MITAEDIGLKPFYGRLRLQVIKKPLIISLIIPIDCIPEKNTPIKKRSTVDKMPFPPRVLFTISLPRSTTYEIAFTKNLEKEKNSSSKPPQKRNMEKFSSTSCRNTIRENLDWKRNGKKAMRCCSISLYQKKFSKPKGENSWSGHPNTMFRLRLTSKTIFY